mgnify:FL=1
MYCIWYNNLWFLWILDGANVGRVEIFDINADTEKCEWKSYVQESTVVAIVFDSQSTCAHQDSIKLLNDVRRINCKYYMILIIERHTIQFFD